MQLLQDIREVSRCIVYIQNRLFLYWKYVYFSFKFPSSFVRFRRRVIIIIIIIIIIIAVCIRADSVIGHWLLSSARK
jgi:hypothetical protein